MAICDGCTGEDLAADTSASNQEDVVVLRRHFCGVGRWDPSLSALSKAHLYTMMPIYEERSKLSSSSFC